MSEPFVVASTENPPTAPGNVLVPGDQTAPAESAEAAGTLTAKDAEALVEKEIG